jgi:CO/xanthine dehydrogenase Mo-binding subunit
VAAAALSVDPSRIVVKFGTTSEAPNDPGAGGSRVTHIVGEAARIGGSELKARMETLAAEVMGWPSGQVHLKQDRFFVGDGSAESASFEEVASRIARGAPVELEGMYHEHAHGPEDPGDFNWNAMAAEVEVDPETAQIRVRDVLLVFDQGTIINPIGHQGQLDGGMVYGLGGTLMEELQVEDGKVTTLSLGEYKLPTQADVPPFRTVILPTQIGPGPYGAKMAGEASNCSIGPAIANAVGDATGVWVSSLPITAEKLRKALQS